VATLREFPREHANVGDPMIGKLIVFEGPDSVGKTTLVSHVKTLLDESQIRTEFLSFPGDRPGTIGKVVYELHHAPEKFGIEPRTIRIQVSKALRGYAVHPSGGWPGSSYESS